MANPSAAVPHQKSSRQLCLFLCRALQRFHSDSRALQILWEHMRRDLPVAYNRSSPRVCQKPDNHRIKDGCVCSNTSALVERAPWDAPFKEDQALVEEDQLRGTRELIEPADVSTEGFRHPQRQQKCGGEAALGFGLGFGQHALHERSIGWVGIPSCSVAQPVSGQSVLVKNAARSQPGRTDVSFGVRREVHIERPEICRELRRDGRRGFPTGVANGEDEAGARREFSFGGGVHGRCVAVADEAEQER